MVRPRDDLSAQWTREIGITIPHTKSRGAVGADSPISAIS
jgi:hypothetical protein